MARVELQSFSEALGMQMSLEVILPEIRQGIGLEGGAWNGDTKLPTLYLLHGMSDDESIWGRRTALERYAADKKLAIVMPTTHLGQYTDEVYGLPYYQYIAHEVPAICERYFPLSTAREDRFVAGLSMGGYGALKIGLREHRRFAAIAAYSSGLLRAERLPKVDASIDSIDALLEAKDRLDPGVYGTLLSFYRTFGGPERYQASKENNPKLFLEEAVASGDPLPKILMACGTEDFLYEANVAFHKQLESLGVEHEYHEEPGTHEWGFWDRWVKYTLDWLPIRSGGEDA